MTQKPTIVVEFIEALEWLKLCRFTGQAIVHLKDGKPLRVEVPNPKGW